MITGGISLAEEIMIIGEDGEPTGWEKGWVYPAAEQYALCRCGATKNPPFCDGSHISCAFKSSR